MAADRLVGELVCVGGILCTEESLERMAASLGIFSTLTNSVCVANFFP